MRSSSVWLSPTDSVHIKCIIKVLNSNVLRCFSLLLLNRIAQLVHMSSSRRLVQSAVFDGLARFGLTITRLATLGKRFSFLMALPMLVFGTTRSHQ